MLISLFKMALVHRIPMKFMLIALVIAAAWHVDASLCIHMAALTQPPVPVLYLCEEN